MQFSKHVVALFGWNLKAGWSATAPARATYCTSLSSSTVGFIGLGNMGQNMAANLLKAGRTVVVYDKSAEAVESLTKLGALPAMHPRHIASTPGVGVLITMLPSTESVWQVYNGVDGILMAEGGVRPSLMIDCSTISPMFASRLADNIAKVTLHPESRPVEGCGRHPAFVDAPVSGGVLGARAGTLTFMCGGSDNAVSAATPQLMQMGKSVAHCGKAGTGQTAKVCNNLVLAVSMAAVSEGLALGRALGLDPVMLSNIFNNSSARCWSSETYNPCPGVMPGVPASRNYTGGFAAPLMVKDLNLALEAAVSTKMPVPMASRALQLYKQVADEGGHGVDFSAIYKFVYTEGRGEGEAETRPAADNSPAPPGPDASSHAGKAATARQSQAASCAL